MSVSSAVLLPHRRRKLLTLGALAISALAGVFCMIAWIYLGLAWMNAHWAPGDGLILVTTHVILPATTALSLIGFAGCALALASLDRGYSLFAIEFAHPEHWPHCIDYLIHPLDRLADECQCLARAYESDHIEEAAAFFHAVSLLPENDPRRRMRDQLAAIKDSYSESEFTEFCDDADDILKSLGRAAATVYVEQTYAQVEGGQPAGGATVQ